MTSSEQNTQEQSLPAELSSGLLVVDADGLALAALDQTELRHVDVDDVQRILGGIEPVTTVVLAPAGDDPGVVGPMDRIHAVCPSVLRLGRQSVQAWDRSCDAWASLGVAHLEVLDQVRHGCRFGDLSSGAADCGGTAAVVADLAHLGLVDIDAAEPDLAHDPPQEPAPSTRPEPEPADDEPGLFEQLPAGSGSAARVVAFRLRVRGGRRLRAAAAAVAARSLARLERGDEPGSTDPERQVFVGQVPDGGREAWPDQAASSAADTHDEVAEPTEVDDVVDTPTDVPGRLPSQWSDARVPVFGVYHSPEHNANLGLGMIVAHARVADGGSLNQVFDLRRASIDSAPMLAELAHTGRPAILLCSDYMWSLDHNLAVSAEAKRLNPRTIVIHGGPHAPSYEGDAASFLSDHPEVDVLARGEGEITIAELLAALGPDADPAALHDRLADVAGITYRHHHDGTTEIVRTPDRPRATDVDVFPSPYLTGEFADVDNARWRSATVESNRGCPYGCTFCDWGQATMSRIRKFSLERVKAELEWVAARGISEVFLADANFGIYERDVEIARHIAELKTTYSAPRQVICSFAKNTVKYTTEIVRIWVEAGICAEGSVALQTTDPTTLQNVARSNIKVEKYDALADEFRAHRLPIVTDLLMGLPGATVESFKADLQRCLDQDVTPRMMETVLLPNSPMNAPEYRARFEVELDASNILVSTSSYSREDMEEMKRLRLLFRSFEHFGLLRHLFRWLQTERGLPAMEVIHEIDRAVLAEASRYPLITWVGRYFDLVTAPPCGWPPFYDEVRELLRDRCGLGDDPELDVLIAVQLFLMPERGRVFPATLHLDHDYVSWLDDRNRGVARPLRDYGPGQLVVDDPLGVCETRIVRNGFSIRREEACDNPFWVLNDWELDSALARPMATSVPYLNP